MTLQESKAINVNCFLLIISILFLRMFINVEKIES